jgi:hypothetical protein
MLSAMALMSRERSKDQIDPMAGSFVLSGYP